MSTTPPPGALTSAPPAMSPAPGADWRARLAAPAAPATAELAHATAAAAFLLLAGLCLGEAGPPGVPPAGTVFLAALVAWVLVSTLAWDWRILGDPRSWRQGILHLALAGDVTLLVTRLHQPAGDPSLLGSLAAAASGTLGWLSQRLLGFIPAGLFAPLQSPALALTFVAVALVLVLPRRAAAGALVAGTALVALHVLVFASVASPGWLVAGAVCLGLGAWLTSSDHRRHTFWRRVGERLGDTPQPVYRIQMKIDIIEALRRGGEPLDAPSCLALCARPLPAAVAGDPRLQGEVGLALQQLVAEGVLDVLLLPGERKGWRLRPDLDGDPRDALVLAAAVPRLLVLGGVCLLWILSPIDLIPDGVPVLGALDDSLVAILGAQVVRETLARVNGPRSGGGA